MGGLKDIIDLIVPAHTVRIELFFVIILCFLFWLRSKDTQIRTLKDQINFLMKLNTGNFIEKLIEREKNNDEKLEKLETELKQLKVENETEKIGNQKLIREKEKEISITKSSAEATANAINASLDYYSTGINTMGSILNLRKELKEGSYITGNDWERINERIKRSK